MDEKLRNLEKQAKTGDSLAFQNFVLEECRTGKHFYQLDPVEFPSALSYDFEKRYSPLLFDPIPAPEGVWGMAFGVSDLYGKHCIWCKHQKIFIEWFISGMKGPPGDLRSSHIIVKEGQIVI